LSDLASAFTLGCYWLHNDSASSSIFKSTTVFSKKLNLHCCISRLESPTLQDNESLPPQPNEEAHRNSQRKLYAAISAVVVIIILLASIIMVPPGQGMSMNLGLNYAVGESMVYRTISLDKYVVNGTLESQTGDLTGLGGTWSDNLTETLGCNWRNQAILHCKLYSLGQTRQKHRAINPHIKR
jgi:hypothetical protein